MQNNNIEKCLKWFSNVMKCKNINDPKSHKLQ